jgi:transmembrane sensor
LEEENIIRFLNSQSSQQEESDIWAWLDQPVSQETLAALFERTWEQDIHPLPGDEVRYEKMLTCIHSATAVKKKILDTSDEWIRWVRRAASYLLLLFSSYLLFQLVTGNHTEKNPLQVLVYERTTVAGEKIKIQLPDQSTVILNSLSTISFDPDFAKTHRTIHLEGEGYFEIQKDERLPFVVQTDAVSTTALGTAFNARSRNGKIAIALTEGKVKVSYGQSKMDLKPGEMALLDRSTGGLSLTSFTPASITAWKEGKISFRGKKLKEVLEELEDWYGVKFLVKENVNLERKISGIANNNNLEEIMNGLSFSLNLTYSINGNQVTVQPAAPMK